MKRKMGWSSWRSLGLRLCDVGTGVDDMDAIEAEIGFWWEASYHGGICKWELIWTNDVVVFNDVVSEWGDV